MYLSMYVCLCACLYGMYCMYVYIYEQLSWHAHNHCVCMYACMYANICVYANMYNRYHIFREFHRVAGQRIKLEIFRQHRLRETLVRRQSHYTYIHTYIHDITWHHRKMVLDMSFTSMSFCLQFQSERNEWLDITFIHSYIHTNMSQNFAVSLHDTVCKVFGYNTYSYTACIHIHTYNTT